MARLLTPDICVVGNSAAGFAVAAAATALGAPVVMIEHGRPVPHAAASALIAAGRQAQAARDASGFGIPAPESEVDFRTLARHVRATVAAVGADVSPERLTALGVPIVKGPAAFVDRRTIVAGETRIRARRFVIAAPSVSAIPAIEGLSATDCLTEHTLAALDRKPARLVVLGASARGLELAQAFRRLGVEVTVIEPQTALPDEDPEMVALLLKALRAEKIAIHEGARIVRVEKPGKAMLRVEFDQAGSFSAVEGSHLLLALGRAPDVATLGLDQAGVGVGVAGIKVSPGFRTRNGRIYAIGEAIDAAASPAACLHQAGQVAAALLLRRPVGATAVPRLVATEPQLAAIGDVDPKGVAGLRILRAPYAGNERARAERRTAGHVKLLTDARGRIHGVSILGAEAGEAIGVWSLALRQGLSLADMAAHLPARPGYGEIGKDAAMAYLAGMARTPSARRWVRLLRVFG